MKNNDTLYGYVAGGNFRKETEISIKNESKETEVAQLLNNDSSKIFNIFTGKTREAKMILMFIKYNIHKR
jgi:hypothetical protein